MHPLPSCLVEAFGQIVQKVIQVAIIYVAVSSIYLISNRCENTSISIQGLESAKSAIAGRWSSNLDETVWVFETPSIFCKYT